jgi:hypothetical protein
MGKTFGYLKSGESATLICLPPDPGHPRDEVGYELPVR